MNAIRAALPLLIFCASAHITRAVDPALPLNGKILDLDADRGVESKDGKVLAWHNQADFKARDFTPARNDGKPGIRLAVPELRGHATLIFQKQELLNRDEDAFDHLITGGGYTWIALIAPYKQHTQLQDVNSFFGNLKNGGNYEGFWAGFNDDNAVWAGSRNSTTFGRWDDNNPKVLGPKLDEKRYYAVAGRMGAGTGKVPIELFVNTSVAVASHMFPVNPQANASKLSIGQERDAVEHPGKESFEGEMSRILMWDRPLTDDELRTAIDSLVAEYGIQR